MAGSSTELAPSLLGFYDTLTSALESSGDSGSDNKNYNNADDKDVKNNTKSGVNITSANSIQSGLSPVDSNNQDDEHNGSGHCGSNTPTRHSHQSSRSSSLSSDGKLSAEYTFRHDSNSNSNSNNNSSNSSSNSNSSSTCHIDEVDTLQQQPAVLEQSLTATQQQQQQLRLRQQKQQHQQQLKEQHQQEQQLKQKLHLSLQLASDYEEAASCSSGGSGAGDGAFSHNHAASTLTLLSLGNNNYANNNSSNSVGSSSNNYTNTTVAHTRSLSSLSAPCQRSSSNSNNNSGHQRSRESTPVGNSTSLSKHRNNIRILSPNVQRIITHSDAEPVQTVDIDALQLQQQSLPTPSYLQNTSPVLSPVLPQRYIKKTPNSGSNATSTPLSGHKVKLSHIPLSKITGKLTQSGNELVETFDSSSEYLDAVSFQSPSERRLTRGERVKKPPTPAVVPMPGCIDGETTPTNKTATNSALFLFHEVDSNGNSNNNRSRSSSSNNGSTYKLSLPQRQQSIKLTEIQALAATTQLITAAVTDESISQKSIDTNISISTIAATPATLPTPPINITAPTLHKEFVATAPLSPCELVEVVNYPLLVKQHNKLMLSDKDTKNSSMTSVELIEAINKPLITKPLVRSSSAACAATVAGSPVLTYARCKSLAAKANTIGGAVPIKLPTAQQLEELEEANKMSAESLDRLTDIKSKFSPKELRKGGPMLPDIAKLKHRPLSSSSICSTSSSSSSGSDQLNGKLTTSYLASVESLADQSENELMDPHSGMSVLERAMLEMVDSERSYVEDLGQVIRGYLLDWKERACLRYDELEILFANIEEIYEFNATLLKQLINSGMDPGKIAKCFIDLRERFDVYTTYCTSYPEAISLLTKLLQATHTNALLTSTQKLLQHKLPLGSYLLKPVQRILKYHLLLDNLRKHCDVKEVLQAYEIMRQVARNIDQVKRKLEQQIRVKELSGILDGWLGPDLTVLGELRQEGILMEHNKPRMVFLFDTMLIITKPKEDNRLQFKSYIHQNNLMLSEHLPGEPTSFYVIPYHEPRNQIKLSAKNRDQKRLWAHHIKGVILEKFDNIPNRAKELVYKLGDEEDRTPDKNTWKWSLHSTSTPVYLERRNQYRRSEIRNRNSKFKRKTVTNSSSFDSFNELAECVKECNAPDEVTTTAATTSTSTTTTTTTATTTSPTTKCSSKSLSRHNSIDDNMLPALQKLAAAIKHKTKLDANSNAAGRDASTSAEQCILRSQRSSAHSPKSPIFGMKALKERSKSVPRISLQCEDVDEERESLHGSNTNLDTRKSKSSKCIEVKQYNHKTIPKRIATLKKQRTSKKETCKFYMDLSDFDDTPKTELKITESTENLHEEQCLEEHQKEADLHDVTQNLDNIQLQLEQQCEELLTTLKKKDADIILDLLKNNKEFERIYKKPQKKRALDQSSSAPTSPELPERLSINELPPRPPSRSPPPLETDAGVKVNGNGSADVNPNETAYDDEPQSPEEEPIYETLLRNVHVPYKFSPVLGRSNSAQNYKPREKKTPSMPRPESDYVTLVYSPEGALQMVGTEHVEREAQLRRDQQPQKQQQQELDQRDSSGSSSSSSTSTLKRDSQNTVISVDCSSAGNISQLSSSSHYSNVNAIVNVSATANVGDAIYALPVPKKLLKRLLSGASGNSSGGIMGSKSSQENISSSHNSLLPRARRSIDNIALSFRRSNKLPERRVSDVSEMCRQTYLHRQGSEAVGERMAHVDYADPRTLFIFNGSSEASLQRDSVFSLTSSSDSVCEQKRIGILQHKEVGNDFVYEDNVEACLENDFRDSAIYSDDNEKRADYDSGDGYKRARSPLPLPLSPPLPPARSLTSPRSQINPAVPPKPTSIPRPALVKSPRRESPQSPRSPSTEGNGEGNGDGTAHSRTDVIICPPHLSAAASRSWVLQQIDNFNK